MWIDVQKNSEGIAREKQKARELKKSAWWKNLIAKGQCHYCGGQFNPRELTMDHKVPLIRGGRSTKSNIVASCLPCNQKKSLKTPAEILLDQLDKNQTREKK